MIREALIETSTRTILNQGIELDIDQDKRQGVIQNQMETALKILKRGKLTIKEIAEDTGLSVTEAERLAGFQTV